MQTELIEWWADVLPFSILSLLWSFLEILDHYPRKLWQALWCWSGSKSHC